MTSKPRVSVWHHSIEPCNAKTVTFGTALFVRTSYSCQILIFFYVVPVIRRDAMVKNWKKKFPVVASAKHDHTLLEKKSSNLARFQLICISINISRNLNLLVRIFTHTNQICRIVIFL